MNSPTVPPTATPVVASSGRLMSLDVLRGFDMFWILGADAVALKLAKIFPSLHGVAEQMDHKVWDGFAFYDLIFPLFVFISGVSLVFSLPKTLATLGRVATIRRILVRAVILFALGVLYNGGLTHGWPNVRLAGVLQRIAIAYAATGVLFCCCRPRTCYGIGGVLLAAYWALLTFVPIRDIALTKEAMAAALGTAKPSAVQVRQLYESTTTMVTGSYARGRNLANHLDYEWLPGRMYQGYWDPEGLLSTLPAIATCLLGMMAGQRLRRDDRTATEKMRWLAVAGAICLAGGWVWHLQFPVVKDLWSSSFVLVAGGYSLWLLAAFYYVVDVRQWRGWCAPFLWIGLNPITLYLVSSLVNFDNIARRLAGGSIASWLDARLAGLGELGLAFTSLGLMLLLARFLYRRGIFLKAG
jgi:predicted acyltransferase